MMSLKCVSSSHGVHRGATSANYDVSQDGRRFLMVKDADDGVVSTRLVVVVNFAEELKRMVKAN